MKTIIITEKERIVREEKFKKLIQLFGVPDEISNCCSAKIKGGLCSDCLEHCEPIYIFG